MNKDEAIMAEVANGNPLPCYTPQGKGRLFKALAAVQGEITGARKGSSNPFFKSQYADLASVWDACRESLSSHGLSVVQTTRYHPNGICVVTTLGHESGEFLEGELVMVPTKNDPQGIGSCITYARRYALAAIVGVAQVDDDGNAASEAPFKSKKEQTQYHTGMTQAWAAKDAAGLRQLWDELNTDQQSFIWHDFNSTQRREMKALLAETKPEVTE